MFRRRRLDAETGLYYYRNRMMSSELERFLQRYPFGYVDGWNLYEYVGGRFLGRVTKVSKNAIDPHCDSSSRDECLYGIFIEEKIRCGSTFFRLFTVLLHGAFYLAHRNKYHTHRKRRYAGAAQLLYGHGNRSFSHHSYLSRIAKCFSSTQSIVFPFRQKSQGDSKSSAHFYYMLNTFFSCLAYPAKRSLILYSLDRVNAHQYAYCLRGCPQRGEHEICLRNAFLSQ